MGKFEALELFAFGPVEDPADVGLPPEDAGKVLVAFMDNSDGEKLTFLVSDDDSQILARGTLGLEGGFAAAGDYFQRARGGWWTEWANPADASAWVTPERDR